MKIEEIEVYGFRAALRGMRNPKESWDKSDTVYGSHRWWAEVRCEEAPCIGTDDMRVATNLIRGGGAHRKFLRQIMVWWDITVPRAIWQELDTYKVATVRSSCSTMHKLGSRDLDLTDFQDGDVLPETLAELNRAGLAYRLAKADGVTSPQDLRKMLHHLKMVLPESFLQKATYTFSYETALHVLYDRLDHRMAEWSDPDGVCAKILTLPYMREFAAAMGETRARG